MDSNRDFIRILNPRCSQRYQDGRENLCSASVGSVLIAKRDMPECRIRLGDVFIGSRCFQPQFGRGKVHIYDNPEKILRFIRKAWYQ